MKLSKFKFVIPSLFTSASIILGVGAIFLCITARTSETVNEGYYLLASWLIIAAAVMDGLDGKVARLTQTSSEFGIEYDSMADIVTFGVAPATLLYTKYITDSHSIFIIIPFLFIICGAIRLAIYNIKTDGGSKTGFSGLPVPVAGGIIANYTIFLNFVDKSDYIYLTHFQSNSIIIGVAILNSILMVSKVRFDVFYVFFFRDFNKQIKFLIIVTVLLGMYKIPGPTLILISLSYLSHGIVRWLWTSKHVTHSTEDENFKIL